ncbi:uncharacterized protein TRIREDRAFT_105133 [Trichoderma reesei QM6a]|uniref:Predicted protein n=2 Tax=Hypocrea jecorina TaxID=51453 RepID=G0RDT4_HYPJQ|nr:uncharacterized protein TRIREDRAFT_105133 [Trichoderma reesei QM6a]EGR50981.1 predicted protein [Trichoderma reesei QM6a]
MASTQDSPSVRDNVIGQIAQEPRPAHQSIPNFRDILSQENRTQSSSSIFVVVDGKEIPKPAKVPKESIMEMETEVEGGDSIDEMRNEFAAVVQDTKTRRGYGLYATSDLLPDHLLLSEQPALSFWMPRDVNMANMRKEIEAQWCDLLIHEQEALREEFPKLRSVPSGRRALSLFQSIMLFNFALEYSYSSPDGDFANIYSLASRINHACRGCANAVRRMDWYEPHRILITLIKPVKAGQEILIHYNTMEGSKLACAVCGSMSDRPTRCQLLRNKLEEWRLRLGGRDARASVATSAEVVEEDDFNADVPGPRLSVLDRAKRLRNKTVLRWGHLFTREGCDWLHPWQSSPWQSPPRTPYPYSPSPEIVSSSIPILRVQPPTDEGSPVRRRRKNRFRGTRT